MSFSSSSSSSSCSGSWDCVISGVSVVDELCSASVSVTGTAIDFEVRKRRSELDFYFP